MHAIADKNANVIENDQQQAPLLDEQDEFGIRELTLAELRLVGGGMEMAFCA